MASEAPFPPRGLSSQVHLRHLPKVTYEPLGRCRQETHFKTSMTVAWCALMSLEGWLLSWEREKRKTGNVKRTKMNHAVSYAGWPLICAAFSPTWWRIYTFVSLPRKYAWVLIREWAYTRGSTSIVLAESGSHVFWFGSTTHDSFSMSSFKLFCWVLAQSRNPFSLRANLQVVYSSRLWMIWRFRSKGKCNLMVLSVILTSGTCATNLWKVSIPNVGHSVIVIKKWMLPIAWLP